MYQIYGRNLPLIYDLSFLEFPLVNFSSIQTISLLVSRKFHIIENAKPNTENTR